MNIKQLTVVVAELIDRLFKKIVPISKKEIARGFLNYDIKNKSLVYISLFIFSSILKRKASYLLSK